MRSHILELWADPRGTCLHHTAAEKCCCCCCLSRRKHILHFAFFFPPPLTPPFKFPPYIMTHADTPRWFLKQMQRALFVCQSSEGLLPGGSHMRRVGMSWTYLDLFGNRGRGIWWPVKWSAIERGKKRQAEYLGQEWSNGRNDEYRAFVMIHEGEDDSSFLVPRSLLSPKQMTFIKGRTARAGFPRLKTRNGNKEREET